MEYTIKPMLCKLRSEPFTDNRHIWEVKYDGIRIISKVQHKNYYLQGRHGGNKTMMFPELHLETRTPVVLDGELVCYVSGKATFSNIQRRTNRINGINKASLEYPVCYEVFDILMANGSDLQMLALEERKNILDNMLIPTDNVRVVPYVKDGIKLFQQVVDSHIEGIIGKDKAGPYRQGKRDWIKVKVIQSDVFVICGYTDGTGWRTTTFGALVLGQFDEAGLRYVGSVGTGFDNEELHCLYHRMKAIGSYCPFDTVPELAHWIEPSILVTIRYLEITRDGRLRFPAYKGVIDNE